MTWYTGEMGTDLARGTAVAKADDTFTVAYGARANEQVLRMINEIGNAADFVDVRARIRDERCIRDRRHAYASRSPSRTRGSSKV